MISKRELLKKSHLYAILDRDALSEKGMPRIARLALSGGADLIQFRDKGPASKREIATARAIRGIARRHKAPFIVNDNAGLALATGADGLHIGQGDIGISLARKLMGGNSLIGVSVKNYGQAVRAKAKGADYLGAGPVFKTPIKAHLKPKGFRFLKEIERVRMPFFAIGGINLKNAASLAREGFRNIAVIRSVCEARDASRAAKKLKEALS